MIPNGKQESQSYVQCHKLFQNQVLGERATIDSHLPELARQVQNS